MSTHLIHAFPTGAEHYFQIDRLLARTPGYAGINAPLRIITLGGFRVCRNGVDIENTTWGREKAIHLFQFFLTMRRQYIHKEQIMDRLWPDLELEKADRDFKVALNSINRALEPEREPRSEPHFIRRYGLAYGLALENAWLDAEIFEQLITLGNQAMIVPQQDLDHAIACYGAAVNLYHGDYLPERRYEDWSSAERERLQILALNTMTTLGELLLQRAPQESLRLAQRVLTIDPVWEQAYRIEMRAFMAQKNRPLALRSYQRCAEVLSEEFGVDPLPETTALYDQILKDE